LTHGGSTWKVKTGRNGGKMAGPVYATLKGKKEQTGTQKGQKTEI